MGQALIVEDNSADMRQSAEILKNLNFEAESVNNVGAAILRLQDAVEGTRSAPDLVLLDLSFTHESGFELLRFWKSNRKRLQKTRVVVWTIMGDTEQQLCHYFGVEVVPKWAGPGELDRVLRGNAAAQGQSAQLG